MALTEKNKMFCEEYVANGYKSREAYQAVYLKTNDVSAVNSAGRLLRNPEIKEYIKDIQRERFEALNISAERIAEEISKLAFGNLDENNNANSKLKALELLGKQIGLYTQKVEADVNNTGEITINIV